MQQPKARHWTAAEARAAFAAAPVMALDAFLPPGPLLVVAPHPDDESLGCGGLIALAAISRQVTVVALTDGAASHPNSRAFPQARLAGLRRAELARAVHRLGGSRVQVKAFGASDGRLEACEQDAQTWLAALGRFAAVAVSWSADPHPDHKAAFRIVQRQAVVWGAPLFAYPIWGLTLEDDADAGPVAACLRLDIGAVLERKRAAIAEHLSQTTSLIDDDPQGFRLSPADIARHLGPFEVFIRANG